MTLFVAFMFGFSLFYYFHLVGAQHTLVVRAQAANGALALAEAGVEEALAQLNPGAPTPVIDRTANGWGTPSGGRYGPVSRRLSTGSYSVSYTDDTCPVIYSTGCVSVASSPAALSRVIRVATTLSPLFTGAMVSIYNINLKGNDVSSDSFDSGLASLSTNGQYDPSKTSTNGDVASVAGMINVGNANIHGDILLGPNGTCGLKNNGLVTGTVEYDFNAAFSDVVLPQASWLLAMPTNTTIDRVTYSYVFNNSGDFVISGLSGNVYVRTNAHVRLKLTGNASPTIIRVAGPDVSAGSLAIYMDGPSFTLAGNDIVDGGNAANLCYFGTPNNTTISFTGNATFIGTIYAPEADFKLGGGGKDTYHFIGACLTKSVTMNGHFNFHFDQALLRKGPMRGYTASSWREL